MCEEKAQHPSVMILANGGKHVGWGHIMRCCSIGRAVEGLGGAVLFAVVNRESASLVESFGFETRIVETPSLSTKIDAEYVAALVSEAGAQTVLIDSYDVSDLFFRKLRSPSFKVGYIDDLFLEDTGSLTSPKRFALSLLVNYGFSFNDTDYDLVYAGTTTRCLIGPLFAPIRSNFSRFQCSIEPEVHRILVTTGSTNPNRALERMLFACTEVVADAEVHVVVGKNARVDLSGIDSEYMIIHEGVNDLSELMARSDIVISSAGSTLYELACLGVPTIALPVVQNQLCNAQGFFDRGLGLARLSLDWTESDVAVMLEAFINDFDMRRDVSIRMREAVDGRGAERIARYLIDLV